MNKKTHIVERKFSEAMWLLLSGELSDQEQAYWQQYLSSHPHEARALAGIRGALEAYGNLPAENAPELAIRNLAMHASRKLKESRASSRASQVIRWSLEKLHEWDRSWITWPQFAIITAAAILIGILLTTWPARNGQSLGWDMDEFDQRVASLDTLLANQRQEFKYHLDDFSAEGLTSVDQAIDRLKRDVVYLTEDLESPEWSF